MRKNKKDKYKVEKETQVRYLINYSESSEISAWGYVGYFLLWFAIPVVGLIAWIFACGSKNRNVRNYARAQIVFVLLVLILAAVALLLWYFGVIDIDMVKSLAKSILTKLPTA